MICSSCGHCACQFWGLGRIQAPAAPATAPPASHSVRPRWSVAGCLEIGHDNALAVVYLWRIPALFIWFISRIRHFQDELVRIHITRPTVVLNIHTVHQKMDDRLAIDLGRVRSTINYAHARHIARALNNAHLPHQLKSPPQLTYSDRSVSPDAILNQHSSTVATRHRNDSPPTSQVPTELALSRSSDRDRPHKIFRTIVCLDTQITAAPVIQDLA
jgi:hypothetical protein